MVSGEWRTGGDARRAAGWVIMVVVPGKLVADVA